MGCCMSSDGVAQPGKINSSEPATTSETASAPKSPQTKRIPTPSSTNKNPASSKEANMSTEGEKGGGQASYIPKEAKGAKAFLPATAQVPNNDVSQPAPVPTSQSSGPKAVKGWAPPAKEWDKETKSKGEQTRIEVKEEWDEDGNFVRTTIKKIIQPDWKTKIEKTTEVIPAAEAAKMGKTKK